MMSPYQFICVLCLLAVMFCSAAESSEARAPRRREERLGRKVWYLNQMTSRSGPVKLYLNSTSFAGDYLKIKCVANVSYNVAFNWEFNNRTLTDDERTKIRSSSRDSLLTIRKVQRPDTGSYTCRVEFNKTRIVVGIIVIVKPRISAKLKPKTATINRGESIVLNCKHPYGNSTRVNITWSQKRLPHGWWQNVGNNSDQLEWKPPRRSPSLASFDVYEFNCEVKGAKLFVRSSIGRVTVVMPGSRLGTCPAEVVEGIQWQETILGMVDRQPCYNDTGEAQRICEAFPGRAPQWRKPNLRDCSSPLFMSIEDEIAALDEGFKVNFDISKTLKELSTLTRPSRRPNAPSERTRLFGKDLLSTVAVLRRTRGFLEKEKDSRRLTKESFAAFTETASNILDLDNQPTWKEIDEDNPETPAELVTALEEFGFELESELNQTGDAVQEAREKNLAFQVKRVNATSELRRSGLVFQQGKSLIRLPRSIFDDSPSDSVAVVSVVYDTLSSILGRVNMTAQLDSGIDVKNGSATLLNSSKIISSTVKPLGEELFKYPVKVVLENNATFLNGTVRKRCVFWQPEVQGSKWSDEGCRVVAKETNEYITTCECNHLTLFAVIVDLDSVSSSVLSKLEIISTVGSAISLAAVILTILTYLFLWKALNSPRFVNLMNLCVAIALLDIFSVVRGPVKNNEDACRAMGILLHYFVLALFQWMLCEGILLCLLLSDIFKKDYGRKWYIFVHLFGWALPALVVAISLGVAGSSEYGSAGNCWLSKSNGFIWAALGPMIVVLLANCVVYGVMLYRVLTSHKVQQEDTVGKFKATARASIVIMPILGFTWAFAILGFFFDQVAFKYLFAIFNSLQGLFIFLLHCVFNSQVQQALYKSKRPERRSILDRIRTQEMRLQNSQDSLNTIN